MGAFDDFLDDDFIENMYPPYEQVVKDVENLSDFAFIKADLQRLKEYITEIDSLLDTIKLYKKVPAMPIMSSAVNSILHKYVSKVS